MELSRGAGLKILCQVYLMPIFNEMIRVMALAQIKHDCFRTRQN